MIYIKPLRLPIGHRIKSKKYMTEAQANDLFSNHLVVEEKMDGKHTAITLDGLILFVEDLKYRRTIPYVVPARYCLFDIYDLKRQLILGRSSKEMVFYMLLEKYPELINKMFLVRKIADLGPNIDWKTVIPKLAAQSSPYVEHGMMEGVVVKLAHDTPILNIPNPISGKFINQEFYNRMTPSKITGMNKINPLFTTY